MARAAALFVFLFACASLQAQDGSLLNSISENQEDTIAQYSIEGLWVVDSPKENRVLRDQPVSSSIVQRKALEVA